MRGLKSLDQWALDSGLEYDSTTGSIRLAVGGGCTWDESLDMSALPSTLGWSELKAGTATAAIIDGKELRIIDPDVGSYLYYQKTWLASAIASGAFYIKVRQTYATDSTAHYPIYMRSGSYRWVTVYNSRFGLNIQSVTYSMTLDYPWMEVYFSFNSDLLDVYIYNPRISKFDLVVSGVAGTVDAGMGLQFGCANATVQATVYYDFLKASKACVAQTPYLTTSPKATMGVVDVYNTIEELPLTDNGNVWEYDKDGAGWVTPGSGTFAELGTALIGGYASTLNLRVAMPSDGLTPRNIGVNGRSMTGEFQPRNFVF